MQKMMKKMGSGGMGKMMKNLGRSQSPLPPGLMPGRGRKPPF
jgi:hypothetical protein